MRLVSLRSCLRDVPRPKVGTLAGDAQASVFAWTSAAEQYGSLIQSWIAGRPVLVEARYPDPDIVDRRHGYQFFYHCHRHGSSEHGHVHLFHHATASGRRRYLRKGQGWRRTAPTHLLAIGVDARGLPISLFTVNRWVTDGFWFDAATTLRLLSDFRVVVGDRHEASARWLTHFVRMYLPVVAQLLRDRDRFVGAASRRVGLQAVLADRTLDIVNGVRIDWVRDVEYLERLSA